MIDTNKMEFTEVLADRSPMLLIKGRFQIHSESTVDTSHPIPIDAVKEQMREGVWRYAYRDLIDPLMRLQRLARMYVPIAHQHEVAAHCEKLNELLMRPASKPDKP